MIKVSNFTNIDKKKITLLAVIIALVLGNIFFGINYFLQFQQIQKLQKQLITEQTNKKLVSFLNLFIQKVLKSDKEISFENRLALENAIRDINDPALLAKWEQFTGGTNEAEIQQGVKALLEALVNKIYY